MASPYTRCCRSGLPRFTLLSWIVSDGYCLPSNWMHNVGICLACQFPNSRSVFVTRVRYDIMLRIGVQFMQSAVRRTGTREFPMVTNGFDAAVCEDHHQIGMPYRRQ